MKQYLSPLTAIFDQTRLVQAMATVLFGLVFALPSTEVQAQSFEGFPDARMRDFERQRACELGLPTCLPQVRRQMEQRRTNQMWMGGMIGGVLILIFLVAVRANKQKKLEQQEELRRGREASRKRQRKHAKPESDDDMLDGSVPRSTLERPRGFGKR